MGQEIIITNPPTVVTVLSQTITLTNAEIIALPTSPAVILPPTEVLNYSGFPSAFPIIVSATVVLNNVEAAYVADPDAYLTIAMGSDWSVNLTQNSLPFPLVNAGAHILTLASKMLVTVPATSQTYAIQSDSLNLNDAVLDNAIVLAAANGSSFSGGNAANSMKVLLVYFTIDV